MKTRLIHRKEAFTIQKKVGLILSILTFSASILNFIDGILIFGNTPFQAITHISVLMTLISSLVLLFTVFRNSKGLRYFQVTIVLAAGFIIVMLTDAGNLTGTLFLIFGIALAYQYGLFATRFYIKFLFILGIYLQATLANVFLVDNSKMPSGIPSILFSLTTIYLFWIVFREEINTYLIRTNQLSKKLDQASSENVRLEHITADQAVLIEERNKELKKKIIEKTEVEKELRNTLKVKDVLLQEVHHRVKNNLTVITSLLNLQHSDNNSDTTNEFIEKNSNRLYAMAAVHEIIHQSEVYGSINLADYYTDITQNLVEIYSGNLIIDINAEDIEVTIDIAVSLGIILNDCVANSLSYGFNNNTADKIISIIIKKSEKIEITISDNGRRLPIDVKKADRDTFFSIWLIKTLVKDQLQGSIETEYDHGNIWNIRIPYKDSESVDS